MIDALLVSLVLSAEPKFEGVYRPNENTTEIRYSDSAGAHVVTFAFTSKTKKSGDDYEKTLTLNITDRVGKKTIWKAKDFVDRCPFDATLELDDESVSVSDLDHDGIGEFQFIYTLGCRSDVSPLTAKLLQYEGATKYALRGQTRERMSETEYFGGDFTIDPAFEKAPAGFLDSAKATWNERVLQDK